jgi:hypothetical protein
VLELSAETVSFSFSMGYPADERSMPAETADLPAGFRALWLRTSCIELVSSVGFTRGEEFGIDPAIDVDVAKELCRFLGSAPDSYREFRLYYDTGRFTLGVELTGPPVINDLTQCITDGLGSLEDAAAAMRQWSSAYGLS